MSDRYVWTCKPCRRTEICAEDQPDEACMLCGANAWAKSEKIPEVCPTRVSLTSETHIGGIRFAPGDYEIRQIKSPQDGTEPPF